MTALRDRIEARRAALLSERAKAEAATGWWDSADERWPTNIRTRAHIAAQDPAATIARVDRELAGIDADLALLALAEDGFMPYVVDNLDARYPGDGA